MADYLLVHDRDTFESQLRPAFADAWQRRSFLTCLPLARAWRPAALDYASRYHVNPDDLLLPRLEGLPFDRALWRAVVGEWLFVAAREVPETPSHLESLEHLLASGRQVFHGSRDVTFGLATYRPGHAGLNDAADVARLSTYLDAVNPDAWSFDDLAEEDRDFEFGYAREWFAVLADLYRRAAAAGNVIVCESIW